MMDVQDPDRLLTHSVTRTLMQTGTCISGQRSVLCMPDDVRSDSVMLSRRIAAAVEPCYSVEAVRLRRRTAEWLCRQY